MALDEIELLNDIRKNSLLTKIQKSGFKIPIAVIALLLAGFLLFLSFSVLLFADVDEETVIPADFYLSYTILRDYQKTACSLEIQNVLEMFTKYLTFFTFEKYVCHVSFNIFIFCKNQTDFDFGFQVENSRNPIH